MVRIEEVLQVAMDSRASDIHLTAGLPPKMRVNGHLLNMDFPVLKPEDTLDIVGQIMTEHQKQMFEERGELDMSFAVTNLGRYRVNA
ncbi:MAG: type IV pili twitching motility protein PilT, partial [Lachnospiraceae bacterium]|nr:type IV pili twitching motility protein PilT [Lachnospiraceae bacterium]